ncbi:MAG TPA: response regulator [Planctomycetota bacterium]|nr:response regulator [Planctomycetota bacterium]
MPKKILVVDDTKSIREIVAYLLRSRGCDVIESGDGLDAWEKATTQSPDLIVLDAMIPKKTGFEICEQLKKDDRWKKIPILMLTAITRDSGKTDEYWREKSHADDFMSKPFKAAELVERVLRLLGPDEASAPGAGP